MIAEDIRYQLGLPEEYRESAVDLYEEAFGQKFALAIPPKEGKV